MIIAPRSRIVINNFWSNISCCNNTWRPLFLQSADRYNTQSIPRSRHASTQVNTVQASIKHFTLSIFKIVNFFFVLFSHILTLERNCLYWIANNSFRLNASFVLFMSKRLTRNKWWQTETNGKLEIIAQFFQSIISERSFFC